MLFLIALWAIGTVCCTLIDPLSGLIACAILGFMLLTSFFFTKWRYRHLDKLSNYLKRIAGGDFSLDIRDNDEGELSILKSEIYKVTVTLYEQAELLKKDKSFLADTLSDISHQLKTPITSIFVMTDLISDESLPQD